MAIVKTNSRYYAEIAAAIREKTGGAETYKPSQMAEAIRALDVVIGLPSGYEKLLYIESTGTQYIDTGFVPNQDTGIKLAFQIDSSNTDSNYLIGQRQSTSAQNFSFLSNGVDFRFGYNTNVVSVKSADSFNHTVTISKNVCVLDDVTISETYASFEGYGNVYICAVNSSADVKFGKARVYSCQIYDNDVLVRDYIPCKNPQDVVGLYDRVTNAFYGNAGSGVFTGG